MIVQTLDDKQHCLGVYHDGKLIYECDEFDFNAITATWNYNPVFQQKPALIASLLVQNKTLAAVCPEYLKTRWDAISARLHAFHKSFTTAKVSLSVNCFYDIVPERFLLEYCEMKNQITKHVVESNIAPSNYDFLRELSAFAYDIRHNKLNIDYRRIARDSHKLKVKNFISKNGFGITKKCREYLEPLIRGEDYPPYGKDGLPKYVQPKNVGVKKKLKDFKVKL